jgi:hypothetical protein
MYMCNGTDTAQISHDLWMELFEAAGCRKCMARKSVVARVCKGLFPPNVERPS